MRVHRLIMGCSAALVACGPSQDDQPRDAGRDARPTVDGAGDDGSGSGDPSSHSIHALAVGHSWRWRIVNVTTDCVIEVTVTGTTDIDGRQAFVESPTALCPTGNPLTSYNIVSADDRLELRFENQATWYVYDPPSEGHSWDVANGEVYTWHATASATVPAGTFSDCWTATRMPAPDRSSQVTFCRGVGQVDSEASSMGATFSQRLVSKNF